MMENFKIVCVGRGHVWYMDIPVPTDRDAEEYIDMFLEMILDSKFYEEFEWDFK